MSDIYISADKVLDTEFLADIVESHYNNNVPRYTHFYDLYKGKHKILKKTVSDDTKANNQLVNDFYGQTIDTIVGYFLGKPIVVHSKDDAVDEALDYLFVDNDKDDLFMEVGKEMCIKGRSAIMVYQDEFAETKLARVSPEDVIFIYDNMRTDVLLYAIRIYELEDDKDTYKYLEVYGQNEIQYFVEAGGKYVLDDSRQNPVSHIYGQVPIIPFINNEEEQSDLEKIESLVDDFDKIMSLTSDEHEAFRNAYLMIKNMVIGNDTLQKLKEEGVIEVMEDGDVKFITKQLQTDAVNSHLDRLKELIHKFSQVPDLSDENFAGNLSGVAIKFKLFGLETKCIIKERKMTKALRKLMKVLSVPLGIKSNITIKPSDVSIIFTRNIPDNIVEITEVVNKLHGTVDRETLLALLPFVDNPQEIIQKLDAEWDIYSKDIHTMGVHGEVNGERVNTDEAIVVGE